MKTGDAIGQVTAGRARRRQHQRPVGDEAALELIELLTVIVGHAGLLGATLEESDDRRVDVAAIVTAAQRATRITAQLMAMSQGV